MYHCLEGSAPSYLAEGIHRTTDNPKTFKTIPQDLKNLNHIFDDHVGSDMTNEEFRQLCKAALEKQHGFVIIDLSSKTHNGKYKRGLDEFYIPN